MTADLFTKPTASKRFIPALCASALFLCVFALYLYAHESDGGWGDGPDFVVCSYFLGVPHPTGYPLFAILGKAATFVPVGTIAFRVGLLSTFTVALGAAVLFFILQKLLRAIIVPLIATYTLCGYHHGLVFSQTVTVEAYALNFLFMAILAYIFLQNKNSRAALWFFLLAAIGLGNHGTLIFAAVILGIVPLIQLLKSRSGGASLFVVAFIIFTGFFLYSSLPLFAARGSQFIWNNPQNLKSFQLLLSGSDFWSGMLRFDILKVSLKEFSIHLFSFLTGSMILILLFGLISVIFGEKRSSLPCILLFLCASTASIFAFSYPTAEKDSFLFLPLTAMFIGVAALPGNRDPGTSTPLPVRIALTIIFYIVVFLATSHVHKQGPPPSHDISSNIYSGMVFKNAERDALILVDHVADDAIYAPVYAQSVENMRPDAFILHRMLLAFPWYMEAMRGRAEVASAAVKIPRIDPNAEANRVYEVSEEEKRNRESGMFANTIAIDAQTVFLLNSNLRRIPVYFNMPELFLRSSFSEKYEIAPTGVLFQAGRNKLGAPIPELPRPYMNSVFREIMHLIYVHRGRYYLLKSQKEGVHVSREDLLEALTALESSDLYGPDCRVYSMLETLYRSLGNEHDANRYKSLLATDFCVGANYKR